MQFSVQSYRFFFFFLEKPKALCLQPAFSFISYSKQAGPLFSSKTEKNTSTKISTSIFNSSPSTSSTLDPPSSPVAQIDHPRRARQEVLKPVVLVLPRIHFPDPCLPQHSQTRPNHSFSKCKTSAQFTSRGLASDTSDKRRPLF